MSEETKLNVNVRVLKMYLISNFHNKSIGEIILF